MNNNSNILIDTEIIKLVQANNLILPFDDSLLSGCSYDLRVGKILNSRNKSNEFDLESQEYIIQSGECVTIQTYEEINLRDNMAFAILCNKHSILGQGIFHPITTVDPGFRGHLAITFIHIGPVPFRIKWKDKICNIYFIPIKRPNKLYGVNISPTAKEGTIDFGLIYKDLIVPDETMYIRKMYGRPIQDLYKITDDLKAQVQKVSDNIELNYLKSEEIKNKEKKSRAWDWQKIAISALIGLISGVVVLALNKNWEKIFGENIEEKSQVETDTTKTGSGIILNPDEQPNVFDSVSIEKGN